MKWRVELEYEDGSFTEPRRIAFQAVCDGEPYYGYETKREALEAFCVGQVAMREMLKEREAEQKEDEQKKEEQKEVKVDMSEETRKKLEKLAPMSIIKIGWKAKAETSPYDGSITRVSFCEVVDGYPTKEEALIAFVEEQKDKNYGDNFLPPEGYTNGKERKIMERLEALEKKSERMWESLCFPKGVLLANVADTICHDADLFNKINERQRTNEESLAKMENRLTEIEGVLSSIGSPDYDLRKKVEELEKRLRNY